MTNSSDRAVPKRERLGSRRSSTTTVFSIGGAQGYLTQGFYPDGRLGEVFLKFGKQGSTLSGLMDSFSILLSMSLQYGVPLERLVDKFANTKFEPAGMTDDDEVRIAQSLIDYVFRRLAIDNLDVETRTQLGVLTTAERAAKVAAETKPKRRRKPAA